MPTFESAIAARTGDEVVIVLFDGPKQEVVAIAKGTVDAARSLHKAIGSALNIGRTNLSQRSNRS